MYLYWYILQEFHLLFKQSLGDIIGCAFCLVDASIEPCFLADNNNLAKVMAAPGVEESTMLWKI
jgi:hypothetical protein